MQFYVKSAGLSSSTDYKWYDCSKGKLELCEPSFIENLRQEKELFDLESISLLLLRNEETQLCLLIQLPKTQRQDYQGRNIRNSFAWVSNNEIDNLTLQGLAASFLQYANEFAEKMNGLVQNDSSLINIGFSVNFEQLKENVFKLAEEINLSCNDTSTKVAHDNLERRIELGKQLQVNQIPNSVGLLVIVAKYVNPDRIYQYNSVWRVLSELEESIEWATLEKNTEIKEIAEDVDIRNKSTHLKAETKKHPNENQTASIQTLPKNKRKKIVKFWFKQGTRLKYQDIANKSNLTLKEVEEIAQQVIAVDPRPDPDFRGNSNN